MKGSLGSVVLVGLGSVGSGFLKALGTAQDFGAPGTVGLGFVGSRSLMGLDQGTPGMAGAGWSRSELSLTSQFLLPAWGSGTYQLYSPRVVKREVGFPKADRRRSFLCAWLEQWSLPEL